MLNTVKSFCVAPITQVQKHMYTHMCTYIYSHMNSSKHINISYTGILFAPSKLTKQADNDLKYSDNKLTKVCLKLVFHRHTLVRAEHVGQSSTPIW